MLSGSAYGDSGPDRSLMFAVKRHSLMEKVNGEPPLVQSRDAQSSVTRRLRLGVGSLSGLVLRLILLDFPLFLSFALYLSTLVIEKISFDYIVPQMDLHSWDETVAASEYTYFYRECNASDITATDPSELVVTDEMSPDDVLKHFNRHGSVIFPNLISPETAAELRAFILEENERNNDTVSIFNSQHRWSFEIQIDHHPSVAKAAKEILSNKAMIAATEKIVGKNPAVTEFTAITAAPGAAQQIFHTDSGPGANKYSRSFFPSYSFFIPLQNTTKEMGATEICPGTHMCSADELNVCDKHGISAAGRDNNWQVGWAALTSQQTFHRGAAHTDPDAPNRVVFYFTFAPRPQFGHAETETRSFARGGTYGAHWTQWGHTVADYVEPNRYMANPWRILRSLSLYKPRGRQWGWDYITLSACSTSTHDVGKMESDDFENMMSSGGLPLLPKLLQASLGDLDDYDLNENGSEDDEEEEGKDESEHNKMRPYWEEFFLATLRRCRKLAMTMYISLLVVYVALRPFPKSLRQFIVIHGLILFLMCRKLHNVVNSSWARNVSRKRLFELHTSYPTWPDLPATIPTTNDILILDHMRSEYLGSFSTVLDTFQPGNRVFGDLLHSRAGGFTNLPSSMKQNLCNRILEWHLLQGRRVLVKNQLFDWGVANHQHAMRFCHKEMVKTAGSSSLRDAITQVDYLIAETNFGYWRDTALHQIHIPKLLVSVQDAIMAFVSIEPPPSSRRSNVAPVSFAHFHRRRLTIPKRQNVCSVMASKPPVLSHEPEVGPPFPQAWFQEGDLVEACRNDDMHEWYTATITGADGDHLEYHVNLNLGPSENEICRYCVRPFVPYAVNETVEVLYPKKYSPGWVKNRRTVATGMGVKIYYDIAMTDDQGITKELLVQVPDSHIRRVESGVKHLAPKSQVVAIHPDQAKLWFRATVIYYDDETEDYLLTFKEGEFDGKVKRVNFQDVRAYEWA